MPPTYAYSTRLTTVELVQAAIAAGNSLRRACEQYGVNASTYLMWAKKAAGKGLADGRRQASGRAPAITLTNEEASGLQAYVLIKEGNVDLGIEFFAHSPRCLPATREWILQRLTDAREARRRARWPDSLRRAAQLPPGVMDRYHGKKATQSGAVRGRFDMTVEIHGRKMPLVAGTAMVFDDYSTNQNYQLVYADGRIRLCRQVLAGMDVYTHRWLSFFHVGKERDAYTAGDASLAIWDTMQAQGYQPLIIVLEQGRWKGSAIRGIALDKEGKRRWGSIEDCGLHLDYRHSSMGKTEIEGGFDLLQNILAGEEGAEIGRVRGIMEQETADMLAINEGTRDATACGFLTLDRSAELHMWASGVFNDRPKVRRELGGQAISPEQLWAETFQAPAPAPGPEKRWLFFPIKTEATIRENGLCIVTVDKVEHVFHVNGIDGLSLPNGYKILAAFDPERPELGAHIANREQGAANANNWRMGQTILAEAPAMTKGSRIVIGTPAEMNATYKTMAGAQRASRTAFRAILPNGKRGMRVDSAKNRLGNRAEIVRDAPEPAETTDPETDSAAAPQNASLPRFAAARETLETSGRTKTQTTDTPRLNRRTAPKKTEAEILAEIEAMEAAI